MSSAWKNGGCELRNPYENSHLFRSTYSFIAFVPFNFGGKLVSENLFCRKGKCMTRTIIVQHHLVGMKISAPILLQRQRSSSIWINPYSSLTHICSLQPSVQIVSEQSSRTRGCSQKWLCGKQSCQAGARKLTLAKACS